MFWLVSLADTAEEKDDKSEGDDLKDRASRVWDSLASEFDHHPGVDADTRKSDSSGLQDLVREMEGILGEMEEGIGGKGGRGNVNRADGSSEKDSESVLDLQRVSFIRIRDTKDPLPLGLLFHGSAARKMEQEIHGGMEELEVRFLHPMSGAESLRVASIIRTLQGWRDRATPLMASCDAMDLTYLYPLEIVNLELERSNRGCRALYGEITLRKRPGRVKSSGGDAKAGDQGDQERRFLATGYRMAMGPIKTRLGL